MPNQNLDPRWHCQYCRIPFHDYATALACHRKCKAWSCVFLPSFGTNPFTIWDLIDFPDGISYTCKLCGYQCGYRTGLSISTKTLSEMRRVHYKSHHLHSCGSKQLMSFPDFVTHLRTHSGVSDSIAWQYSDLWDWSAGIISSRSLIKVAAVNEIESSNEPKSP
ncbi:hypothetical protein BDV96DRAFT_564627 [Lophiotrema nucula]|uniref:Uncharacterized protein n=1 Tax=Lophiotrema nucula TaxID=690887 RepID=A0A6A5ZR32_9PLEO|nr:hypothetical protein BDV96DRAFT_564627 [Lophiotrema nucula]